MDLQLKKNIFKYFIGLITFILIGLCYYSQIGYKSLPTVLEIELDESVQNKEYWQLYLKKENEDFTENKSIRIEVEKGTRFIRFPLLKKEDLENIRIDFGSVGKEVTIVSLRVKMSFLTLFEVKGEKLYQCISNLNNVKVDYDQNIRQVKVTVFPRDPHFEVALGFNQYSFSSYLLIFFLLILLFALSLFPLIAKSFPKRLIDISGTIVNITLLYFLFAALEDPDLAILFFTIFFVFTLAGKFLYHRCNLAIDSFLLKVLICFCLGLSSALLCLYFFAQLNFSIAIYPTILLILLMIVASFREKTCTTFFRTNGLDDWIEITLFSSTLLLFLLPLAGLLVPPLHDPLAGIQIGQYLLEGNFNAQAFPEYMNFYPPLLGYLNGFLSYITNIPTYKVNGIITNFFSVCSCFMFSYLIGRSYGKQFNYWTFLLYTFLFPHVPLLYVNAGKNAQILAFFLWFTTIILFKIGENSKLTNHRQEWWYKIAIVLLIACSFGVHYTTIFILPILLLIYINNLFLKKKVKVKALWQDIKQWIVVSIPFLLMVFLVVKNITFSQKIEGAENQFNITKGYVNNEGILNFFDRLSPYSLEIDLALYFIVVILYFITRNRILLLSLGLIFIVFLFRNSGFGAISHYSKVINFFPALILISVSIAELYGMVNKEWYKFIFISLGLLLLVDFAPDLYGKYMKNKELSVLTKSDIRAFKYISNHLEDGYFLPLGVSKLIKSNHVFVNDGALYLDVFTNTELATPFYGGNHFSHILHKNKVRYLYQQLLENVNDTITINKLKQLNINYLYWGAHTPFGTDFPFRKLQNSPNYQIMYNKNKVMIYKFR